MITNAFLSLTATFLEWLLSFFPYSTGFDSMTHDAFIYLGSYFSMLDPIFPIATLLTCVLAVVAVELSIYGFKFLRFLLGYMPFIGK